MRLGIFVFRETLAHTEREHVDEHLRDDVGAATPPAQTILPEHEDRPVHRSSPFVVELGESAKELETLVEVRSVCIEDADDPEVLSECFLPLLDVIGVGDRVDQRHARPPGPSKATILHSRPICESAARQGGEAVQ